MDCATLVIQAVANFVSSNRARLAPAIALWLLATNVPATVAPDAAAAAEQALYSARYKRAIELYSNLLKQDPDWAPGYYGLVRALIEDEQAREAYMAADEGLRRLPIAAETLTAVGLADFRRGDLAKAQEDFQKARQIKPQYPGAIEGLARLLACTSHFKTARDFRLGLYRHLPQDPGLAITYADTLKGAEHIAALERALALYDPASREARGLRVHIASEKSIGDRKTRLLSSPYKEYTIKLLSIKPDPRRVRGLGVSVKFNGRQTVRLMLDTGASGISISPKAAAKAGLELLTSETGETRGIGDGKTLDEIRFLASSLEIGDLSFSNYVVSAFRSATDSDIDGLIGADVFQRFLVTINFPRSELLLEPFNDGPAPGVEPEDAPPLPAGFFRAIRFGSHLTIFTGANDKSRCLFLIDSGSSVNLIDTELAAEVTKVHQDDRTIIRGIQGRVKDVSRADRITLTFAGFRQENPGLVTMSMEKLGDSMGAAVGGIIGMPVLWNLKLTIDYRAGAIRMVRGL